MATSLLTLLPPTRSGRTFFFASLLLGLCAFVQFVLLSWYLLHGTRTQPAAVLPLIPFAETTQPTAPTAEFPLQPVPYRGVVVAPGEAVTKANSIPPLISRPTPVPTARSLGEEGNLLEQARQLRQHGDMNAALGKLREAQVAEPDNPSIIAETAITYDGMQLADKAAEQWQRLYNLGETVGALYYLADSKLHSAPANAASADGGTLVGAAAGRAGFQANASLKITDIHLEELADPAAEKKLALKIVVKNRPGVVIDPNKVKIEAYFYDLIDGRDVVQTDAQTDYAWLTPPPINWANDKSEVLEAIYMRARGMGAAALAPDISRGVPRRGSRSGRPKGAVIEDQTVTASTPEAPVRAYLGYTVRLYYDRQLQDVQADPVRLLQQFPPPMTLSAE